MRYLRLGLAQMLLLVAFCGITFAALKNPTIELANTLATFALGIVLFAGLAIVYRTGRRRAFWAGFATFGGFYLLCTTVPFVSTAMRPRLLSTIWIERLYLDMNPQVEQGLQTIASRNANWVASNFDWQVRFEDAANDPNRITLVAIGDHPLTPAPFDVKVPLDHPRGSADPTLFHRAGQSLFSVLVGWLGGLLGLWLHSSRDRPDDLPDSPRI
jgi:hypothetical protein